MARTQLTIRRSSKTVDAALETAHTDNNYWLNSGHEKLEIFNGAGVTRTVTIVRPVACSHGLTGDDVISIPAGEERIGGPWPTNEYNQASPNDGQLWVNHDAITGLSYRVVAC